MQAAVERVVQWVTVWLGWLRTWPWQSGWVLPVALAGGVREGTKRERDDLT